jgi:hypothetical protein
MLRVRWEILRAASAIFGRSALPSPRTFSVLEAGQASSGRAVSISRGRRSPMSYCPPAPRGSPGTAPHPYALTTPFPAFCDSESAIRPDHPLAGAPVGRDRPLRNLSLPHSLENLEVWFAPPERRCPPPSGTHGLRFFGFVGAPHRPPSNPVYRKPAPRRSAIWLSPPPLQESLQPQGLCAVRNIPSHPVGPACVGSPSSTTSSGDRGFIDFPRGV